MARYLVRIQNSVPLASVVTIVRKITGAGFSEIKKRISLGRPVAAFTLPSIDGGDEKKILELLDSITRNGESANIYEIDTDVSLDDYQQKPDDEISVEMLKNIIESDKVILEQIQNLAD